MNRDDISTLRETLLDLWIQNEDTDEGPKIAKFHFLRSPACGGILLLQS